MSIDQINSCCGIGEIESLGDDPKYMIGEAVEDHEDGDGYSMYVFTDNVSYGAGRKLAAYIRRMKLGRVTQSPVVSNPRHSSRVRLWCWIVNKKSLSKWATKNKSYLKENFSHLDMFRNEDDYYSGYNQYN